MIYFIICCYFLGNAGDSLAYHNGLNGWRFSTKDKDNDGAGFGMSCALWNRGAWWYRTCNDFSNLNGLYLSADLSSRVGIVWYSWKNDQKSMKKCGMKVRSNDY